MYEIESYVSLAQLWDKSKPHTVNTVEVWEHRPKHCSVVEEI